MKGMNTIKIPSSMTAFMLNIQNKLKGYIINYRAVDRSLNTRKTDTGMYEYPSSPSLVLHLGELDDKPKVYFEKTKEEVSRKNALAKWVHQHKMQNVNTSDNERKVEQEYQKFKRKQN